MSGDFVTILSIDGGGIRGIIPALILDELEHRAGLPTADLFDLIAGTSTGGILGLGLTVPGDDPERPRYSALDLADLYRREGSRIFPTPGIVRDVVDKFAGPKYPGDGVDGVLREAFGDAELRDARAKVMVTSYDVEAREAFMFKSWRAVDDPAANFLVRDAARATSAAPTYFPPARVAPAGGGTPRCLIDGGVFANNPTMAAFAEANRLALNKDSAAKFVVVSLGTGDEVRRYPADDVARWGLAEWAVPLLDVMFDGVSMATDYAMRNLLGEFRNPTRYFRLQGRLDPSNDVLDDTRPEAIASMEALAARIIEENSLLIQALATWLRSVRA